MIEFNPFTEPYLDDPYPYFERYRTETPVFYDAELDHWVVSRYEDVKRILKDSETYSNQITLSPIQPFSEETVRILEAGGYQARPAMVGTDAPYHTKSRKLMNLAFTPRRVAALEPKIRELVMAKIDEWPATGRVELVKALTYELPALVLFHLLGVPDEDVPLVKEGAEHRLLMIWGKPTPDHQAELANGLVDFWRHTERLVELRSREPGDDLTSELLRIRGGDDAVLTLNEIASLIFGLLFAGHETTTAFLTNAVRRLLEMEGGWRRISEQPSTLPAMVEELLRFDSSVIAWRRLVMRDTTVGDVSIPAGARMLILLGAANHDPARFGCPHQVDFERSNVRDHLAFGFGIHYCLGAALARLEARVVLECLAARAPELELVADQKVSFHPNVTFRGPRALWVER